MGLEEDRQEKNEDLQVETIDDLLVGKDIALCVTGGIASIETPKIARQLRRYGADVRAYMTKEAEKFVGIASLEWATQKEVINELSGLAEHICREDLVLVAPATANTISKITAGIADNPVTTLAASAMGMKKPVMLAPCMHESLYNNPFFVESLQKAERYHIGVIKPRFGEKKAKIAKEEVIVAEVIRRLSHDPLSGLKILVTAGPTPVYIDSVRKITNDFEGTLGILIASELYMRGADVKLLLGNKSIRVPGYLDVSRHRDFDEYYKNVFHELKEGYDAGIFSAAVADYAPKEVFDGKIPSREDLTIEFGQTKKVIEEVREKYPLLFMVTFKYEIGKTVEDIINIALDRAQIYGLVVANRKEDMAENHKAYVVNREGVIANPQSKKEIAKCLASYMGEYYESRWCGVPDEH